jgi:predicted DNA-binding transcriptional regulator AlpA
MESKNDWFTPQEVAKYLGISLSQVYSYMRQYPPPWPFYRVTQTKRLTKKSDLDAWLEKVKVSAAVPKKVV